MSTYSPQNWSAGDAITPERMNRMADNDQFLFESRIQSKYTFDSIERTSGIRIWASNGRFPISSTQRSILGIDWSGYFSPGCNPIVNVTLGRRDRNRCWVSVKGPGEENWPNSRGCEIHGIMDPDTASNYNFGIYMPLHILAVGW